jgi:ABC-type antimicrobial peptide transport system permease subunit
MLARTAARSHEIAVRHALGAGRRRIVMQLFVESLLLCTLAAAVGLALAELLVVPRLQVFESAMPYWFDLSIKPFTVVVAGSLAVFSAIVSGLLPALKITGKRAYQVLQRQSAGGDTATFAPRLRTSLAEIQPTLVPDMPVRLDRVFSHALWEARVSAVVFTVIAVITIVLSAAALYALMAFSVSQRTREIAIRTTLGAPPFGIVRSVVSRAVVQLAIGVVLGAGLAVLIVPEVLNSSTITGNWRQMLIAVSTAMTAFGLLACVAPTRRALRIQPVEALKECG